jgi:hypothetical protein
MCGSLRRAQRAQVEREVGHPHDHQPQVGVPLGLGVFLRLGDPHQVAGRRDDAEQVVADQHEPRAELVGEPRAAGPLDHVEAGRDEPVAAEAEDHPAGVQRAQPPVARPRGVEREVGPDEQRGDPHAGGEPGDRPDHRQDDADLARVVVVGFEPFGPRLGIEHVPQHHAQHDAAEGRTTYPCAPNSPCGSAAAIARPSAQSTARIQQPRWRSRIVSWETMGLLTPCQTPRPGYVRIARPRCI